MCSMFYLNGLGKAELIYNLAFASLYPPRLEADLGKNRDEKVGSDIAKRRKQQKDR